MTKKNQYQIYLRGVENVQNISKLYQNLFGKVGLHWEEQGCI